MIGGHVNLLFSTVVQAIPHLKAASLKAIAVGSPKRSAALPDTPTIAESGMPGYDVTNWFGLLGPRDMPRQVIDQLSAAVSRHLRNPEFMARLAAEGAEPVGGTPAEFAQLIASDIDKYSRIVKETRIRVE